MAKDWRSRNPDMRRRHDRKSVLKWKYGITFEQYENTFNAQGCTCAICGSKEHGGKNWNVDHCHSTGMFRGVLCNYCNLMLGYARDNYNTLHAAIEYLQKHATAQTSDTDTCSQT